MAATQGQAALLHQNGSLMRLLTGKNVGKKISTASRSRQEGRKAAQVQASQRPNPGSKRKVSSNDLSRLSKIFGPSRYTTAYGPQEEGLPPPPPPDASNASSSSGSSGAASSTGPRGSSAHRTTAAQEPPKEAESPAAAWARRVLSQPADDGMRGQAILGEAQSLQQLVALSREPKARALGPAALLAIADRAWALATTQGIADEQELEDVQGLGEFLVLATHPHITASAFSTSDLALLLRTPLCLNHPPSAAWLKACEGSALRTMGAKAQQAAQRAQQGEEGAEERQEMQGQRLMLASLVEEADGILAMSASFLSCGFQPRPEFMAMFMDTAAGYMQLNEQECLRASQVMTRAAEARKVGRRGGLIEVPEQLEVDEVLMADGSSYSAQVDNKSKDAARVQQQQQQEQTQGGAVAEEDLCVVSSFNWNTICEAVLRWGGNDAPAEWVQTFIDASYAAMRASLCVMAVEEDSSINKVEVGRPLVARVLDTNVIANIMTTGMYAFRASPGSEWLATLCALCQAVLEFVREHGGQEQEGLEASGGVVANPVGLVNIFLLLRFVDYQPEPALVNAALGAVGKSYGGPGLQQVPGDALATLMLETGRHQYELDETAKAAAVEFALEAQSRWARALQERMNEEAKRRGRTVAAQQQQQPQQEGVLGEEEGQQKEQEFTKLGMLHMLEGASSLGILPQLPPEWMLLWGEEVMVMAEEFDAEDVIVCLASAAKGGVSLSSPARTKLVGRLLEVAAPKPVPESASITSTSTASSSSSGKAEPSSAMPSVTREIMSLDMLRDMMESLLMQADGSPLPGSWMSRMQALVEAHLPSMEPPDMVSALKVLGLLEVPPSETFLQHIVAAYTAALARAEPPKDGADAAAPTILASDEEACLELASGLAAVGAPPQIMQVVEDASLRWSPAFSPPVHQQDQQPAQAGSGVALEFWVGLLAKFAAGAHLPQQQWWQALEAATMGAGSTSASSSSGQIDGMSRMLHSMSDAQLANLLAAYGALRVQHGPGVDQRGGDWAAQLALQAAHRLDGVTQPVASAAIPSAATSATLQSVVYLVGGLGTLFVLPIGPEAPLSPHIPRVCAAIEGATLTQAPLLSPSLVSACFAVFSPVAYTPGQAWLEAAGAAAARGLPSADGHDLATLLAACQTIPAFRTYMPTPVVNTLLRTAVQEGAAGGLQPSQMLSLINSAAGLNLDARVGAPHATQLRTLLEQAAGMRESFPPAGLAQLLKNAALMGAQPPGRWLDAMLSAFERVDFLGPAFGGPEPLLQLLVALDAWDHHPLPPWLRLRLCEALPGVADMGVHAMRLLDKQQQRRLGKQDPGQAQQQEGQQQQQEGQQQGMLEMEIPVDGEEGEAMLEAAQSACLQCSHASVLLLQYLANTSPRSASASSASTSSSSPSNSGRTTAGRKGGLSSGSSRTDGSGSDASAAPAAGIPAHLLAPTLSAFQQLVHGDCLPPTDHAGLVYSLARLSPAKAAADPARAGSSSSSSSKAAKEEEPVAAVAAARQGLLESLMPTTAAALPSYSMLELVTIFSSFGALGAPLPPAWLDVFWEYSRPQLHACPAPMLAACLDAVASLRVRPAGAWEGALWGALDTRASRLSLTDIDQLVAALMRAQLRPPEPLLQQLLEAALTAANVPLVPPLTAQQMAANLPAGADAGTLQEGMVGSTRVRRSERAAPATARDGGSSVSSEDASASALAAAQLGRRAVQLSRVLGVANRGMGYQPPSEWMNQFRGVAATALGSKQLPPQERSMLMEVMQATASMP
uniref:Uncharacterized protein n=1 Tax=Dunaliella tertiolecta TaxID=3047 RepID=A0A7S3R044_DUNTE